MKEDFLFISPPQPLSVSGRTDQFGELLIHADRNYPLHGEGKEREREIWPKGQAPGGVRAERGLSALDKTPPNRETGSEVVSHCWSAFEKAQKKDQERKRGRQLACSTETSGRNRPRIPGDLH